MLQLAPTARRLTITVNSDRVPKHESRFETTATVKLGEVLVASAKFGGKKKEDEVLRELRQSSRRWTHLDGWDSAVRLGLIPA